MADVVALDDARQRRQADLDSDLKTAGGMLHAARDALNLTRSDIARRTNIKEEHVAAIEAMNIAVLPSQPYTMGFVRAYAREVSLPEDALMDRFRQQAGYTKQDLAPGITPVKRSTDSDGGRELSVIALLAVLGVVLWICWQLLVKTQPGETEQNERFSFSADDREVAVTVPEEPEETLGEQRVEVPEATLTDALTEEGAVAGETGETAADVPVAATPETSEPATASVTEPTESVTPAAEEPAELAAPQPRAVVLQQTASAEAGYPPLCRGMAQDVETVTIAYNVDSAGRIAGPRITSSTNPCFNGAALAAISRWRFDPATVTPSNSRRLLTRFVFDKPA